MGRQILAIDIRNDLIAAVLLETGLKANSIVTYGHVPIKGDGTKEEALSEALTQLLIDIPNDNASLVVALPAHENIYRTLTVPFKENTKIKQVLPFELEPDLPMPVEDLVIGFQKNMIGDQTHLMAAATERQNLERYMTLLSEHNLRPQLVVPGSFPAVLELVANEPQLPDQSLIIDVDKDHATLYALTSGRISMVRSLPAGIDSEPEVEQFALRVRQTLTAFADSQALDFSPSSVLVHGPALDNPNSLNLLSEALEMPTEPISLYQRMNKVEIANAQEFNPWLYDSALASACLQADGMDCANFHRSSSTMRNFWAVYRPYIRTPAVLLTIAIILGLGSVIYDNSKLKSQLDGIKEQSEQIFQSTFPKASLSRAPILDQMKSKLKEAQKNVAAPIQGGSRVRSVDALLDISKRIPNSIDVTISRMVVSDDAITLSGETGAFNTVDDIKGRIEKSDLFKKVTIASANTDKSGKNVRFKLKIEL